MNNNSTASLFTTSHSESTNPKLRIGLIVNSEYSSKYVYELAEWGQLQEKLTISHLIIQKNEKAQSGNVSRALLILKTKGLFQLIRTLSWMLIVRIESRKIRETIYKDHLDEFNLGNVIHNLVEIEPQIFGSICRFSNEDIEKIKNLNLDLLIRFGSGILRGGLLTAARLGIISFHHADNRINRGGPAGFWEIYNKQASTGFIIQRLTEELDGGDVLFRGAFPTLDRFIFNNAALLTRSNFYLKKLLFEISQSGNLPKSEDGIPYNNRLFKTPELAAQIKYIVYRISRRVRGFIEYRLLKKRQRWGVAFCRTDWKNLVMWRGIRIKNPPNHFLADPFVITEAGRDYCFVEDYNFKIERACISVYEIEEKKAVRLGEAIAEPFHMSFPYLFRFKSKLYMVPETYENKDIRLYECVNFPLEWKLCKLIMSGISAVDTMIFEHGGLWWLFTNIALSSSDNEHCSELSIFYSENPLSENWRPHLKNPVIVDPTKARNAGILFGKDNIYRVGQRYGFTQYGKGFSINKICLLTASSYEEQQISSVEPNYFDKIIGTHHLHCRDNISVFDYVEKSRIDI